MLECVDHKHVDSGSQIIPPGLNDMIELGA
jgi:hypothetical protein